MGLMKEFRRAMGEMDVEGAWDTPLGDTDGGTSHRIEARLRGERGPAYLTSWSGAPVSEWCLLLFCTRAVLAIDLFRDVLISLPPERVHDARDVVSSAGRGTLQLWRGIASTGLRVLRGRQFFGADEFDRRFVLAECERLGLPAPGWHYAALDTGSMAWPLKFAGLVPDVKLDTLTEFFGIDGGQAHRALNDARRSLMVAKRICSMFGSFGLPSSIT